MSNQRPGKVVRAIEPGMKDMTVLKFFKTATQVLKSSGHEDESFYFEQMVDYLQRGNQLPLNEEQTIKALGV